MTSTTTMNAKNSGPLDPIGRMRSDRSVSLLAEIVAQVKGDYEFAVSLFTV
jgi:hypothetical protein